MFGERQEQKLIGDFPGFQQKSGSGPFRTMRHRPQRFHPYGGYQPTLEQFSHRSFGMNVFKDSFQGQKLNKQKLYSKWRVKALDKPFGGTGKDEMTRTSFSRDTLSKLDQSPLKFDQKRVLAGLLSMNRAQTDALVWYHKDQYGGHPGSLRSKPNTNKNVVKGHGSRDQYRASTALTEFLSFVPKLSGALFGEVQKALWHTNARTEVETIRTMSLPYEQFKQLGPSKKEVYHAQFGDLRKPDNFDKMARYVHKAREKQKWDTGAKLMMLKLPEHVPDVMRDYLKQHQNDHHSAFLDYQKQVKSGSEKRVNTTSQSQAPELGKKETLVGTHGRKRALSIPRLTL